jgi:peptidyl-prolyl cis-trans isomerase B (cyclophilin B)
VRALVLVSVMVPALITMVGCGGETDPDSTPVPAPTAQDFVWPTGANPRATLHVADMGDIVIELYPELAPETVKGFLRLARKGFYDGTTFHRVVPGFVIQGGDPLSKDDDRTNDGNGYAGRWLPDEFSDAPHLRGVVSMANTGLAGSASSQFFIVHQDSRQLDGKYSVFGRVVRGMDVVDAITQVEIDHHGRWGKPDRPMQDVVISGVTVSGEGATAAGHIADPNAS